MSDPLAKLLALEQSFDDFPEGAEARILARVESVVAGGPGDGGNGGDDSNGGGASGGAPATLPTATKGAARLARAAYLAVGLVAGAAGHAALVSGVDPSQAQATVGAAPPRRAEVTVVPDSASALGVFPDPAPPPPVASAPALPHAAPRRDDRRIGDERADLDVARTALSLGRIDACLDGIDRHARIYGEGHFAEEREVLAVQALAAAGRKTEAAARAERFHRRYPTSLFGPALTESLATP